MSSRVLPWGGRTRRALAASRPADYASTARWKHFDWVMLLATLLLAGFGLLMIYSATSELNPSGRAGLVSKQAIYLVVGLALMALLASIDYRFLTNWTWVIYISTLILLAMIFVVGRTTLGSTRWFDLGPFTVQPSELSKLLMVLVLAWVLAERPRKQSPLVPFLASLLLIGLPLALIFKQPDLGTSMVLGAIWLGMILVSGTRLRYLLALAVAMAPVGFLAWRYLLKPYQVTRVLAFLDPEASALDSGYNMIQARISVGAGGLTGQGYMEGSQSQLRYLRVQHTDFIASVIGEEFGFVGMVALLLVFGVLLWRTIRVADLARDRYGELIATGVAAILLFQIFVNIGMNLGLMPVTGIPLPFVSYGGSALVTLLAAQGVLQSILLRHKKINL